MVRADKLDELLRLLAQGVALSDAQKRAGVSVRAYAELLKDSKNRVRVEAAMRGVMAPSLDQRDETEDSMSLLSVGFYEFLSSPEWCGLEPSPAVRAIALASDGRAAEINDDALCVRLFGCDAARLPRERPRVVVVRSGGQCGKTSRLGAPKAVHSAITVPLPNLRPGQWARSLITAPTEDLAQAAIDYCRGILWNSPRLRALLTDEVPEDADEEDVGTRTRIGLKRPDGHLVEIRIKAANSGGMGARSRSLVNALLDEVCFFRGADSKVNDVELYRAAVQRVVPDGQVWLTSTPWIEGFGKLEEFVANDFGKHESALVALASTRIMFPGWDPERKIESQMRKEDAENAAREIDGIPLSAAESAYYSPAIIRAAEQREHTAAERVARGAGGDFAFVRNSSALAVAEAYSDGTFAVVELQEYKPQQGRALRPSIVCAKHARLLHELETFAVVCDGHYRESVREHFGKPRAVCPACGALIEAPRKSGAWTCEIDERDAPELGQGCGNVWTPDNARAIGVIAGPEGARASDPFKHLRDGLNEGLIKLPPHPRLAAQLRAVEGKPRPGPGQDYAIRQPEQRNAGPGGTSAHGDLVSAVVLALYQVGLGRVRATAPVWLPPARRAGRRVA